MINNLRELNKAVNDATNYIVKTACEETKDGKFSISFSKIAAQLDIENEELRKYAGFILSELRERAEILEVTTAHANSEAFTVLCDSRYCPIYEWSDRPDRESLYPLPIRQPLDLFHRAEIGEEFISALIAENRELAEEILKDKLSAVPEELAHLGFKATRPFHLETIEASADETEEVEEETDKEEDRLSWAKDQLEEEAKFMEYSAPYVQELENVNNEQANKGSSSEAAVYDVEKSEKAQTEISPILIQEARDNAILSLLENDHRYQVLRSLNNPQLEEYTAIYKEMAAMFLPQPNDRFIIQGAPDLSYNGYMCSIIEPTVIDGGYAFKVALDRLSSTDSEAITVRYEDLVPYKSNDLIVGKWRIHLIAPGDRFGKNNSVINNNETLIEFWDMHSGLEMARRRELKAEQFSPHVMHESSEASDLSFRREDWHRRKMAALYARQGQFTGGRYYLSKILEGYKDYFNFHEDQSVRGLCLNGENRDVWTVSPFEMKKILYWLEHRPVVDPIIYEVKGEVEVPLEVSHEQEEIIEYLKKKFISVYGAFDIHIGRLGTSKASTNAEFSLKTNLKHEGIENVVKMLLPECDVIVNINRADPPATYSRHEQEKES